MAFALATWSDADRSALRRARERHGHSQQQCAQLLRQLGCSGASQTAVSRWETGRIERPRRPHVSVIRQYVEALPEDHERGARSGEPDTAAFEATVRDFTAEPLLGPRQAAFVDGLVERLRAGPPMSEADDAARMHVARLLSLD